MLLKSGKKVATKGDFDALTGPEKQETLLMLTGPTTEQKLITGINWREPIKPDYYVNRGGIASPDLGNVRVAGELPAPDQINIDVNPHKKKR